MMGGSKGFVENAKCWWLLKNKPSRTFPHLGRVDRFMPKLIEACEGNHQHFQGRRKLGESRVLIGLLSKSMGRTQDS